MEPYDEPHSTFWRPVTIAAGAVLLIVLLLLGYLLFGLSNTTHTAVPHSAAVPVGPTRTARTTTAPAVRATSRGCSLPAADQTVPEMTPQGITWTLYQTVALPSSPSAGPQIVDGDIARCYAHTPLGALLAATQLSARYLIAPDWRAVVAQQVAPGTGRQIYIAERAKAGNPGGNQPGDYSQFAGFKFVSYSPALAVVELVTKSDGGVMQATTSTVDWSDRDWKLQLQPDGSDSPNALPVTSLVGFNIWSGV